MRLRWVSAAPLALVLLVPGARAAVSPVGEEAFDGTAPILDFEEFTANTGVVMDQFSDLGVSFTSASSGGWPVEPYVDYGGTFATVATDGGFGDNALFHANDGEEILFSPPVRRVGFFFGSNAAVDVPVTFFRAGEIIGSASLAVSQDQLLFFGFEDPEGIERVAFGTEQNSEFVSQLDQIRFERVDLAEPGDFAPGTPVLGFEEFTANTDVVSDQFSDLGVSFTSVSSGGWPVEPYSDYGTELADLALASGAGSNALFHLNDGEELVFSPTAERVGFLFGSNVEVRVPVALFRGGVQTGSFTLEVPAVDLDFFAFEDPGGIDRIAFGVEENSSFVSQLDDVRVEPVPEPGAGGAAALAALAALARWRRRRAALS